MKKILFVVSIALLAVACCQKEATVVGAWGTETACGQKQVMVLEEDGTVKACPSECVTLQGWALTEAGELALSGERFSPEDSAMVAFTHVMAIETLTVDSLILASPCGNTLRYARLACKKGEKSCSAGEAATCGKKAEGCCQDKDSTVCAEKTEGCCQGKEAPAATEEQEISAN